MPVPAASLGMSLCSNWFGIFLNTCTLLFCEFTGTKVTLWGIPLSYTSSSSLKIMLSYNITSTVTGAATGGNLTKTKPAAVRIPPPRLHSHRQHKGHTTSRTHNQTARSAWVGASAPGALYFQLARCHTAADHKHSFSHLTPIPIIWWLFLFSPINHPL